jgi:acyl-coenzyme A thioesterase PaaI-like protein
MLLKETVLLRLLSLRSPAVLRLAPRVLELDDEGCAIRIPLGWRNRNHVGSMYVGVLCSGADIAAGLNALRITARQRLGVVPILSDLQAEFLMRADGDVVFRTRDGRRIAEAVRDAAEKGERVTLPVEVIATVPEKHGSEAVARFRVGLSVRKARATARPPSRVGEASGAARP